VVEADEYDRSFLRLSPDIAAITSMDPDHLDIYGTGEAMEEAFIEFSQKVKPGGLLISKKGLSRSKDLKAADHIEYSLNDPGADVYTDRIRVNKGSYTFDVITKDWTLKDVVLNMGGLHNIENVLVAITVAHHLRIEDDKIKAAVASFKGVKRRFEYTVKQVGESKEVVVIDDYAHHPEELRALITGVKNLFPDMHFSLLFQPHLFSRTRDFADEFAATLDMADETILLPIYPARELPMEGVTSQMLIDRMKSGHKQLLSKEELMKWVETETAKHAGGGKGWVLVTAGAGDIDALVQPIRKIIEQKY
jgi:UDP-N-acetylmuramate--alanine ligase